VKSSAEQRRLDVVDRVARGTSVRDALRASGYSDSTVRSMAMQLIGRQSYRKTMRQFAEALAEKVEVSAASELEILRLAKAPAKELVLALRGLFVVYNRRISKELRLAGDGQFAITKKVFEKYWTPETQRQIEVIREKAKAIQPGDLAKAAMVVHLEDLISPPKDARARNAIIRTAYEKDGLIGSNPAAVHLHEHQSINIGGMPTRLRNLLIDRMIEITRAKHPEKTLGEVAAIVQAELGDSSTIDVQPAEDVPESESAPSVEAPSAVPDVDLPVEDPLHRREIVSQKGFIKSMHRFLGVES